MADGDVCVPLWEHTPSFAVIPLPPFLSFLFLMDDWCVRKTKEEKTSAAAASTADRRLSHIRGQRTKVFPQKTRKINIQTIQCISESFICEIVGLGLSSKKASRRGIRQKSRLWRRIGRSESKKLIPCPPPPSPPSLGSTPLLVFAQIMS